ncbi:hypothetical protein SAY87_006763 [Trapa incisa]|uniref:Protein TIFY n=1 Tax=Trapa incisa TaxID=236973 RepID=A0AAN7JZ80_9MYRT|nr:hypothetical protein SAY87_006763 [Trapa incisa]
MWIQPESAAGTQPEKRSFSQTCILLSRYLKDNKVALGHLIHVNRPFMIQGYDLYVDHYAAGKMQCELGQFNLTPMSGSPENPMANSTPGNQPYQCPKTMNLFPQYADSSAKPFGATEEHHDAAQMIISYAGQVAVFDDLPAEKANEILLLAEKERSFQAFASQTTFAWRVPNNQIESNVTVHPCPNTMQDCIRWRVMPIASSFPQARRCSLQRFLKRRKDRLLSKHYARSVPAKLASFKSRDDRSWINLAANKCAYYRSVKDGAWVALELSEPASSRPAYDCRSWLSLATGSSHS